MEVRYDCGPWPLMVQDAIEDYQGVIIERIFMVPRRRTRDIRTKWPRRWPT